MKTDFKKIIKNAWQITWYNKYLWWFGFLISLGGVGMNISYKTGKFPDNEYDKFHDFYQSVILYIESHWVLIFNLLLLLLMLFIGLWILKVISKGALIGSLYKLSRGEAMNIKKSWKEGLIQWKKLFELELIIFLIDLLIFLFLLTPIFWLAFYKKFIIAFLLFLVAIILILFLFFIFGLLNILASFYIVIGKVKPLRSLNLAYMLLSQKWVEILIMVLIFFALSIGVAFALIPLFVVMLAVIISGVALGNLLSSIIAIGLVLGAIILGFLILAIVMGWFNTFKYASWFFLFTTIAGDKNKDLEEKELVEDISRISEESAQDQGGEKAPVISKR